MGVVAEVVVVWASETEGVAELLVVLMVVWGKATK